MQSEELTDNDRGWRGGVAEMALMKEGAVCVTCVVRTLCLCLSVMRPRKHEKVLG